MKTKYITDQYDSVYFWSNMHNAWMFAGKLNGRSLKKFLVDQEEANEDSQE